MPQLRKELLSDNWVVVAESRSGRPFDYDHSASPNPSLENCPFEPGVEDQTPPETDRISSNGAGTSDWLVRSVPNKYPAFHEDPENTLEQNGLFSTRGAHGHHEVIIENPQHDLTMDQFTPDQMDAVLRMYQKRIRNLSGRDSVSHVQIFRNSGKQAGASLSHPHSQLAAFPFVPDRLSSKLRYARNYRDETGQCALCRMIDHERSDGTRILIERDSFIALCPYAPRHPYEIWVLPIDHRARFQQLDAEHRGELADLLPAVIARLTRTLTEPAFNVILQNTPGGNPTPGSGRADPGEYFHWAFKIIPRIKRSGGFELATDIRINDIPPEHAAAELRD